jgi:hypothetical protein
MPIATRTGIATAAYSSIGMIFAVQGLRIPSERAIE